MVDFIRTLFEWPNGIVVGNLIASVLWVPFTLIHIHKVMERHHLELKKHISAENERTRKHVSTCSNGGSNSANITSSDSGANASM